MLNSIKPDTKKTWDIINNFIRSNQMNNKFEINSIVNYNQIIAGKNDIASKFNTHFTSIEKKKYQIQ